MQEIMDLATDIHRTAVDKGFWEPGTIDQSEKAMLIISELSEAVEAHRHNKRADITGFENLWWKDWRDNINHSEETRLNYIDAFETCIKDTVEDELADTVIRLLDFTQFHGIEVEYIYADEERIMTRKNFASACFIITFLIASTEFGKVESAHDRSIIWSTAFTRLKLLCDLHQVDLHRHMVLKLTYNKTRAYKHGKLY